MALTMADQETTSSCTKRRRKSKWSDLPKELLESILEKMSSINILRFKAVCSSWRSVAESRKSSSSYTQWLQTPPVLMLPGGQEEGSGSCCFFSLEEDKVYNLKNMPKEFHKSRCVGSSHGWLVLLDERADPYILNPFSGVRIQLPFKETFPYILHGFNAGDDDFAVGYVPGISKAVLSSDPSRSKNSCGVIAIYGIDSKLAFCKCGDSTWTNLNGKHQPYCDIICYNNQVYALGYKGLIEEWDFQNSFPIKIKDIEASPFNFVTIGRSFPDVYSTEWYLVESLGDFLLVVRLRGEFVGEDGVPVLEADLLRAEDSHPLVCPYKTLQFYVYKLDFNEKKWVEVESLGDRVLFLGGSHSMSLSARAFPECKENSIYFTDDYWDRMNEDYLYGGHDLGVFNLEDLSIKPLDQCDLGRIQPPPFWIVPNPW